MNIPIIDFRSKDCVEQMYEAYTTVGFAVFTHVYDEWIPVFKDWEEQMELFFQLPRDVKQLHAYSGVAENLGYSCLENERLTPSTPGDLKESYNWVSP
jgi:isopenicillin N synthase-like dioxygenase